VLESLLCPAPQNANGHALAHDLPSESPLVRSKRQVSGFLDTHTPLFREVEPPRENRCAACPAGWRRGPGSSFFQNESAFLPIDAIERPMAVWMASGECLRRRPPPSTSGNDVRGLNGLPPSTRLRRALCTFVLPSHSRYPRREALEAGLANRPPVASSHVFGEQLHFDDPCRSGTVFSCPGPPPPRAPCLISW